jgi:enoyl-CoA hydratase/carnithine racemase
MAGQSIETGTEELLCEVEDRVATITFNRPEARNSLSDTLTPALRRMVLDMGESDDVGALLITGVGDAFCSGGNFKEIGGADNAASESAPMSQGERIVQLKERQRTLTGRIAAAPKPVIAALAGPAAGAGMSIAMACDIRIAADTAFMTTAYANIGLPGDYGMSWLLARAIGPSRAKDLMFTAERITAKRCLAIGLFNYVVPKDDLQAFAFDYAKNLANGPTAAFAAMKDNVNFACNYDLLESLDREAGNMIQTAGTEDHRRAVRAFIEGRKK